MRQPGSRRIVRTAAGNTVASKEGIGGQARRLQNGPGCRLTIGNGSQRGKGSACRAAILLQQARQRIAPARRRHIAVRTAGLLHAVATGSTALPIRRVAAGVGVRGLGRSSDLSDDTPEQTTARSLLGRSWRSQAITRCGPSPQPDAQRRRPGANRVSTSCGGSVQVLVDRVNSLTPVFRRFLYLRCRSRCRGLAAILPDTERARVARLSTGTTTKAAGTIRQSR